MKARSQDHFGEGCAQHESTQTLLPHTKLSGLGQANAGEGGRGVQGHEKQGGPGNPGVSGRGSRGVPGGVQGGSRGFGQKNG